MDGMRKELGTGLAVVRVPDLDRRVLYQPLVTITNQCCLRTELTVEFQLFLNDAKRDQKSTSQLHN